MNWRIEQGSPFALLRELPDGLFQTCILQPPAELPAPRLLAVLGELHRVTRADGTLWLLRAAHETVAIETGWHRPTGRVAHSRMQGSDGSGRLTIALFSKQPEFHFNARLPLLGPRHRTCVREREAYSSRHRRRAWCVAPRGRGELSQQLIDRCIQASTSLFACQFCGAPWRRHADARGIEGLWRPGCAHADRRGRCLVLDPFCGTGLTGLLAVLAGRSFLGFEPDPLLAHYAQRRLASASWAALR